MARRIVVDCDPCSNEGQTSPGRIVDFVFRVTDPANVTGQPLETLRGTLEICEEHGQPLRVIEDLTKRHGSPLSEEAARKLAIPPKPADGSTQTYACHECDPPKTLRKGSLHSHCQTQHNLRQSEANIQPLD